MPRIAAAGLPVSGENVALERMTGETMGTRWSLVMAVDASDMAMIRREIEAELATIVAEMSQWEPDSIINAFNRAPANSWHALPERFRDVLRIAMDVADDSGGAFDPALGQASEAWGFGAAKIVDLPDDARQVDLARAGGGWRKIQISPASGLTCQPGGVILDFSGVAKGYAVDRLAAVLKSAGVPRFLIEIGGELVGEGVQPDGQPWWVEAENPPDAPLPSMRIALCGMAVATSGNYRRWLNVGDRRFGHTIDPRDGRPFDNGVASATVLHRQCAVADALATALCVLGPEQGMDYAKARGLAARFVLFDDGVWSERLTPALVAMIDPSR